MGSGRFRGTFTHYCNNCRKVIGHESYYDEPSPEDLRLDSGVEEIKIHDKIFRLCSECSKNKSEFINQKQAEITKELSKGLEMETYFMTGLKTENWKNAVSDRTQP